MTLRLLFASCLLVSAVFAQSADVVVYSAVPAGIASAITAAREGAKVILVEPTRHVGGLSTSGVNTAESEHMLKWTIGGFASEFYRELGNHYGTAGPEYYFESGVAEQIYLKMLTGAGVSVRFGAAVDSVTKDGVRITSIALTDGSILTAKVFIDASYEGDLMARAGVEYAVGRESREEYGEEAAGIRFDKEPRKARTVDDQGNLLPGISGWAKDYREGSAHKGTMNYNFRLTVTRNPEMRVPIPEPKHYDANRYTILKNWLREQSAASQTVRLTDLIDLYKRRNDKFEINNKQASLFSLGHLGGQFDWSDADDSKRKMIYQDHLNYTLGLLRFLAHNEAVPKNVRAEMAEIGLHKDEFADNGHLPYQLYIREARRLRGVYVVKQGDVQTDRHKPDSIGISSHFIDCHHVQRLAINEDEFVNEGRIWRMGYAYQIPYRSLIPKENQCTNLLVPGAAGFSHVAFCTYRLESVWMIGGHAAGVAAAMAAKNDVPVQKIDIRVLQEKLRNQKQVVDFLPGQPEKCEELNGPPEF